VAALLIREEAASVGSEEREPPTRKIAENPYLEARIDHVRDILEHTSLVMCFLVRACRGLEPRFGEGGHLGDVGSQ
jgi:hypothetical protein